MTKSQEKYYIIVCPSSKLEASDGHAFDLLMQEMTHLSNFVLVVQQTGSRVLEQVRLGYSRIWLGGTTVLVLFSVQWCNVPYSTSYMAELVKVESQVIYES